MNKNNSTGCLVAEKMPIKQFLLIMRTTIILLFTCVLCSMADTGYSQNARVTINKRNAKLKEVLNEIEKQTDYLFIYNNEVNTSEKVSIKAKQTAVSNVLSSLLDDKDISYSMEGNHIILNTEKDVQISAESKINQQQKKQITGTVVDASGLAVIGANIMEVGTTNGTVTDADGEFTLNVEENAVIHISYIGYLEQNINAKGISNINVTLQEDTQSLDEVIVVGYGTQKKANLTGAVSSVKGDDISKRIVAQSSTALQGMIPGLTITQQSGQPGYDGGSLNIRGIGSISAGTQPLVLVNNVEMGLNNINPNTIESISVLKDAASSSIYGSRAANGVILITTKRGNTQNTRIQYNYNIGSQSATNLPRKVNSIEHMEMYDIALQNVGREPVFTADILDYKNNPIDNFTRFNTDWVDLLLTNNGLMQSHNISLSSGLKNINIYANASYLSQNGLTPNTNLDKYNLVLNNDLNIFENLKLKIDLISDKSIINQPYNSPSLLIMHMVGLPAVLPAKFEDNTYGEAWNNFNPVAMAEVGGFNKSIQKTNLISTSLVYKPISEIELLANYSVRNIKNTTRNMQKQYQVFLPDKENNVLTPGPLYPGTNSLNESWSESTYRSGRVQLTYNKTFKSHNFNFISGYSLEDYIGSNISAGRQNFINQEMSYLDIGDASTMTNSGGIGEWSLMSIYSRINYNYENKYLLEINGRYDGSSRFSKDQRWGFFPSFSIGWRMSEEDFWNPISNIINSSKLRVSYGVLGNQSLSSNYPTVSMYNTGENYNYFFGNSIVSGYALTEANNPMITWESAKQFNVGTDLSFINNKLFLTADYFVKNIYNLLQRLPIPILVGVSAPYVNAGMMKNNGWEIALEWRDKFREVNYGIALNVSDVTNKVIDLKGEEYINGLEIIKEGEAINSYYGYISDGLFQSTEEITSSPFHFQTTKPGDIKYKDISGPEGKPDNIIDNFDRSILGNSFPRYEYSLNTDLNWRNFDFSLFFQGVGKKDNYLRGIGAWAFYSASYQGSAFDFHKDSWSTENQNAEFPRLTVGIDNNQKNSDYWIKSGAYLRLKNLVFGYTLPITFTKKLNISHVRLFFSGQNLFTLDDFYKGFDPERDDNNGQFYPLMKTYNFGINLSIN